MNPLLDQLHPYPFQRLASLLADVEPAPLRPINLGIGEPRHAPPALIREELERHADGLGRYAATAGTPGLRETIAAWLQRRFGLDFGSVDPERHVLPVAGTREALFAIAQAVAGGRPGTCVVMPNPCYQIYEGAALLAGAEPVYLATQAANDHIPDLDAVPAATWDACALVYTCSPGNPSGRVLPASWYERLLELAERHDFVIAADECYSELYRDEAQPPVGLLQVCRETGRTDFRRCLVFHSLSKRSSAPGLRSGFVAGDAALLAGFLRYRTYQGCALPLHVQAASQAAWADEAHVVHNRQRYRDKFSEALEILAPVLEVTAPEAGFYLWPQTPVDDETFARELFREANVRVLPGRYLGRGDGDANPGAGRVRIALVPEESDCTEALWRIRAFTERLSASSSMER